jgi:hypothetical protein
MDACSKCKKPAGPLDLRGAPGGRGEPEVLCPACYARWAEFQLEAFIEEVHAIHAEAHGADQDRPPGEALRACRWDACKRAGRLAQVTVVA